MSIHRFATSGIGRIFRGETVTGLSEWQLLERYLERQDEVAFEALVARHGPMVLGVCRRMLASQPDVEDAFQATFLVLVRRARQLGPRDAIGPWLYGVAARVALRARCEAARRRRFESIRLDAAANAPAHSPADLELTETLDQELSRLPSKYRAPIILCYLQGQTHEEAATALKWPIGTVKGRLARARDLLRSRLARHGLAPTALAVTASLANDASASVPRELLESTVNAGLNSAIGHTTGHVISTSVASLVEGALTAMLLTKIKWIGAVLLIAALAGAGVMAQQRGDQPDKPSTPLAKGTGSTSVLGANLAANGPSDPIAIQYGATTIEGDNAELLAFAAKAELELAQPGFGGDSPKPRKDLAAAGARGRAKDPKSRQILGKLEEPISMSFAKETPLNDILKYIKQATTTPTFAGVPIYVDPVGLQEAEKSLNSTVSIDLEGVPLRRTLQLVLKQIGLAYLVDDGMILITSEEEYDQMTLPRLDLPQDSPILDEAEKALRGDLTVEEMKEWLEKYKMRMQVARALNPEHVTLDDSQARLPALNEEIKKLTTVNDELKKKIDKLETQLTEIRQLVGQLAKQEKAEKETKKAARLQ